jgi:hypothetical protein
LRDACFVSFRDRERLPKGEKSVGDRDLIAFVQLNRLVEAPLVQKGSIAAAEID